MSETPLTPPGGEKLPPPPPHQPPPPYAPPPPPDPGAGPGYPPPGAYPLPQYGPPGHPGELPKGLAIGAFVTSLFPLVVTQVVAIGLAIPAIRRANRGEAGGKGLAVAGLVISLVWGVLFVIGALIDTDEIVADRARDKGRGEINVTQLEPGDCLSTLPSGDSILTVDMTDCSAPHVGEVYAVFAIDAGTDPGQARINRLAEGGCSGARFTKFVGTGYDKSELEVFFVRPSPETIDIDDEVACVLVSPDQERTTGSLKGSKR